MPFLTHKHLGKHLLVAAQTFLVWTLTLDTGHAGLMPPSSLYLTSCLAWRRYVGDTRAAIVPFLAHKQLGDTYKWLLYGDDDTVWFMDGVLDVLSDLDPDTPYFISGQLWARIPKTWSLVLVTARWSRSKRVGA